MSWEYNLEISLDGRGGYKMTALFPLSDCKNIYEYTSHIVGVILSEDSIHQLESFKENLPSGIYEDVKKKVLGSLVNPVLEQSIWRAQGIIEKKMKNLLSKNFFNGLSLLRDEGIISEQEFYDVMVGRIVRNSIGHNLSVNESISRIEEEIGKAFMDEIMSGLTPVAHEEIATGEIVALHVSMSLSVWKSNFKAYNKIENHFKKLEKG